MKIKDLKIKWKKEKNSYKLKEVGSGVQKFAKDFLKSEDFFNLKEGLISTPSIKRKNEFTEESKTKAARKVDIIIYINPEIVIPVEVEKYGNIEMGVNQLLQYQLDLDKKYGILTDGYNWRFYNNDYPLRDFNLDQAFADPELFNEFWQEYIKPEFYYLSFFKKVGQLKILPEDLSVDRKRQEFFQDITTLINGFKNKLKLEGYFNGLEKKIAKKKAIEITYAYIIQFILYKTLVDNDFGEFAEEFENSVERIHNYLKNKRYKDILGIIEGISAKISKNIYRPFTKEQEFIRQKLLTLYRAENKISDIAPWLDIFIFIKNYNFANVQNEIFGYIYENYLKELHEEEKKGQYFTDPAIVNFMLQKIGFEPKEIKRRYDIDKNSISLIDPACGSGTFLYGAVDRIIRAFGDHTEEKSRQIEEIVNKNIYGLDIAEFPLYLAEMNVLMRMLPLIISEKYNNPIEKKIKVFLTNDSVAEFIRTGIDNTKVDIAIRKGQLKLGLPEQEPEVESFMRDDLDVQEMKRSLQKYNGIPRLRYDYVIGNPPYIAYNECCKQKILITQLMKKNEVKMSNIYGVNLNTVPGRIKAYAPKPNLYAFFISLGLALLKDDGKFCYIIPQTLLTATDLDVIRYHLAKFTTIEKIITFSGKVFLGRGLRQNRPVPTSSLIFVVSKEMPNKSHKVEILNIKEESEDIEKILNSKKISKKKILQIKLLQKIGNWNFIKFNKKTKSFFEKYISNSESLDIYRLPDLAKLRNLGEFYFDKGLVFPKNKICLKKDLKKNINYFHLMKKHKDRYQLSLAEEVIPESAIRFPKGSQGINVFEKRYKIIWRYMNYNRFYFTDKKIMINFNWIVISSDEEKEMFYLLALLNSRVNRFVFSSLLKSAGEKDLLLGIKVVKDYLRVPRITRENAVLKNEVISATEKLLALEDKKFSDFVDFSKVMIQKFDTASVEKNNLVLEKHNKKIKLPIRTNVDLVTKILKEKYIQKKLISEKQKISLHELKDLPIIDFKQQQTINDYIDDLVFVLYFKIPLKKIGLGKTEEIKTKCSKNPYYKLIQEI